MSLKKVPVRKEKIVAIHNCTQSDKIAHLLDNTSKLSVIITGNGDPEKGLSRQASILLLGFIGIFGE